MNLTRRSEYGSWTYTGQVQTFRSGQGIHKYKSSSFFNPDTFWFWSHIKDVSEFSYASYGREMLSYWNILPLKSLSSYRKFSQLKEDAENESSKKYLKNPSESISKSVDNGQHYTKESFGMLTPTEYRKRKLFYFSFTSLLSLFIYLKGTVDLIPYVISCSNIKYILFYTNLIFVKH